MQIVLQFLVRLKLDAYIKVRKWLLDSSVGYGMSDFE